MTAAQIEANRANALLSTGPRTTTGKQISSQNACRHNLTGGSALAPGEDPGEYNQHLAAVMAEHGDPRDVTARFVVRQIADAMWRLDRCQRMENELMELSDNPFASQDDVVLRRLERLERYRQSIERTYSRFCRRWTELRTELQNEAKQSAKAQASSNKDYFYRIFREQTEADEQMFAETRTRLAAASAAESA